MGQKNVRHKVINSILLRAVSKRQNKHYHLLLSSFRKRKGIFTHLKGGNEKRTWNGAHLFLRKMHNCGDNASGGGVGGGNTCAQPGHLDEGHAGPKSSPHFARQAVCPAWAVSIQMKGCFFLYTQRGILLAKLCADRAASAQKGQSFLICAKHLWSWQWSCTPWLYFKKCH